MRPVRPDQAQRSLLATAFRASRPALANAALFSCIINLLMLAGPLFMLQVYDRVLASKNVPTLVVLTALVGGLFVFLGLFDIIRSRISVRVGRTIDDRVNASLFAAVIDHAVKHTAHMQIQPLRDLETLRQFLSGLSLGTLFDLPWTPIYLGVIFLLHPHLGLLAVAGVALLAILALLNDRLSRSLFWQSAESAVAAYRLADESRRHAASIRAMGMLPGMQRRWHAAYSRALEDHVNASDHNGTLFSVAKTIRLFLQSAVLAFGAYLAVKQEITPGTIIAASIVMGRAAAPIEHGISLWRGVIQFRLAYRRLNQLFIGLQQQPSRMALPPPKGQLKVEGLAVGAPGGKKPILTNVNFSLEPGEALGVIGPTGAGKSTLARALVNVWPPLAGTVFMDGAPFHQWDINQLGHAIGYLAQEVELFDGTFEENIARFTSDAPSEAVISAATLAGIHDLILGFPDGYKTEIGEAGARLSAGQRQRIGLARALYGKPVLVVMDEPNANLDTIGEVALAHAIRSLKKCGIAVVVIAHRPSVIAVVDRLLCLKDGRQYAFGAKDDVLGKVADLDALRRQRVVTGTERQ
jgi:PrtD family type I secretion system ABC transporter